MSMQTDVQSSHLSAPGSAASNRVRLKGAALSANATAASRNTIFANNLPKTGTYGRSTTTVTVTMVAHGLATGDRVWLTFSAGTGGTATNNAYSVTVTTNDEFTVTDSASGSITASPAVSMYSDILMEIDCYNPTAFNVLVPGEGILFQNGIYVGVVANVTATVFYG